MTEYLSAEDIRWIHEIAIQRYGGVIGEHEPGQIEFMAQKPGMISFGVDLYPNLFSKAAAYLHGFATRQFFVDGNKRTAYIVTAVFLELNGYALVIDNDELYDMAMTVANNKISEQELSEWLKHNVQPII